MFVSLLTSRHKNSSVKSKKIEVGAKNLKQLSMKDVQLFYSRINIKVWDGVMYLYSERNTISLLCIITNKKNKFLGQSSVQPSSRLFHIKCHLIDK